MTNRPKISSYFLSSLPNTSQAYNLAMKIRNTTQNGEDGDIYYIEAKYLETKYHTPNGMVADSYRRAIKFGCNKAVTDFARYQSKYGLKLDLKGSSY